jgi:hypothetical protein
MQKNIAGLHGTRFGVMTMEARLRTVTALRKDGKMESGNNLMRVPPSESGMTDMGIAELPEEPEDDDRSNSDSDADDDSDVE